MSDSVSAIGWSGASLRVRPEANRFVHGYSIWMDSVAMPKTASNARP